MAITNQERVGKAMDLLRTGLAPFVEREFKSQHQTQAADAARRYFGDDRTVGEDFRLETTEFHLRALHTPGHASDHLCYLLEEEGLLFSGDHVMEGSTVVIAPPDGDMAAYLDALRRLRATRLRTIAPGHGHLIEDPRGKLDEYLTHRGQREQAILAAVDDGVSTVDEIVSRVYVDVPDALHPVARYSVHAHLLKLADHGETGFRGAEQAAGRVVSFECVID